MMDPAICPVPGPDCGAPTSSNRPDRMSIISHVNGPGPDGGPLISTHRQATSSFPVI